MKRELKSYREMYLYWYKVARYALGILGAMWGAILGSLICWLVAKKIIEVISPAAAPPRVLKIAILQS